MKNIIILSNGPGEVWGWARPLTAELKKRNYHVTLWLLPCPFSSGRERSLARIIGSDEVYGPYGTIKTLFDFRKAKGDIVVQLGGDLLFGRSLTHCLKVPLVCYSYGPKKGMGGCDVILSAFPWMVNKIEGEMGLPVELVGDLTLDSLEMDSGESPWGAGKGIRIVLFPGSRPYIREKALLFMAPIVRELKKKIPDLNVKVPFLPDVTAQETRRWLDMGMEPVLSGSRALLEGADLVLTQPGTNNFEIMHMGAPVLVILPFEFLDIIPVSGIKGMFSSIPRLGPWIKKIWLRRKDKYTGYLSWPNRMADREIIKEIRGDISPGDVREKVLTMLSARQELKKQRQDLLAMSLQSPREASSSICNILERLV